MRLRLVSGLLIASLGLAGVAGGERGSVRSENRYTGRVGLATSTIFLPAAQGYRLLQRARSGGIRWVREDFPWNGLEPAPNRFDWRLSDTLMRQASRLGIDVLALPSYAPPWASGRTGGFYAPRDSAQFAVFVKAIANRYGTGGSFWKAHRKLRPRPLRAIELWNEPWVFTTWRPEPDPVAYAQLVRAGAEAIKSVHPEITVLASADIFQIREDAQVSTDWFSPLLQADPELWRSQLVDAWSVHPYSEERSPWDSQTLQRWRYDRVLLTRDLARAAGADKPIWITEVGWATGSGQRDDVSEETQAAYVRDALARAATEWRSFVPHVFVFTWNAPGVWDRYNLLRADGTARPAWKAITELLTTGG